MNYIEKTLQCSKLNTPVKAKYFIGEMAISSTKSRRIVRYFDCEAKNLCRRDYDISTCTCFLELKNIEKEVAQSI